ncbi:MAG: hypothetical protein JWM44_2954 [Bacilli bacterium]|nr:hypothetical protein [Bacilli bacterium]
MANVLLRPDLKTQGGEVNDILLNGRYVGSLSLVYRENQRIAGAVQLDKSSLPNSEKEPILAFVDQYIQSLSIAFNAEEYNVTVTYSDYEQFIEADEFDDEAYFEDIDRDDLETLEMEQGPYELVIVGEGRNKVEYHVYDEDHEWVAEAFMKIHGTDVFGEIHWIFDPTDDDIEEVTELLVADFDEDQIDTFVINHQFEHEIIETIDLTHVDLLEGQQEDSATNGPNMQSEQTNADDYTVVLARDDEDMLTYEIYQQSQGGLAVGTATIDISKRQLTGFIDFRDPASTEDLDVIVALLLQELDKEKEYAGINLTMLYQNKPIDELSIECEQIH